MRNIIRYFITSILFASIPASALTYHVSSSSTNTIEDGSIDKPYKSIEKVQYFGDGDSLLLKAGDSWVNQSIILRQSGSKLKPLIISSYGSGAQPQIINHKSGIDGAIIFMENSHGTTIIDNIRLSNNSQIGIRLTFSTATGNGDVVIRNCTFDNVASGIGYGYGVYTPPGTTHTKNVTIDRCSFLNNISAGLRYFPDDAKSGGTSIENLNISNSIFNQNGDFSIHLGSVKSGSAVNNVIMQSGNDLKAGSTSIYLGSVSNFTIDGNRIHNTSRISDNPDGCGIDFEANNRGIIVKNNIINNGHGAAILIYNNGTNDSAHGNTAFTITRNVFYNNNQNMSVDKAKYNAEILIYGDYQGGTITNNSSYLRYDYTTSKISERFYCQVQNGVCASMPLATMNISGNGQGVLYFDYAVMDISFEPNFYSSIYFDIYNAFGNNSNALRSHWNSSGITEGRIGSPAFDANFYYIAHPDLQKNIGRNYPALRNHFLNYGIKEGRISSEIFDVSYYKNTYPDISTMSNTDACKHFLTLGILEGRTGSRFFSVKKYIEKYPDLQSAYGVDYRSALSHYYRIGKSEGRLAPP